MSNESELIARVTQETYIAWAVAFTFLAWTTWRYRRTDKRRKLYGESYFRSVVFAREFAREWDSKHKEYRKRYQELLDKGEEDQAEKERQRFDLSYLTEKEKRWDEEKWKHRFWERGRIFKRLIPVKENERELWPQKQCLKSKQDKE